MPREKHLTTYINGGCSNFFWLICRRQPDRINVNGSASGRIIFSVFNYQVFGRLDLNWTMVNRLEFIPTTGHGSLCIVFFAVDFDDEIGVSIERSHCGVDLENAGLINLRCPRNRVVAIVTEAEVRQPALRFQPEPAAMKFSRYGRQRYIALRVSMNNRRGCAWFHRLQIDSDDLDRKS